MKTIYFIRHGQTKYNVEGRFVGSTDLPLSEEGRQNIFNKWDGVEAHIDREIIFTSPMKRCLETAGIIFPNDRYEIIKNMREMNFGIFEGKTHNELENLEEYKLDSRITSTLVEKTKNSKTFNIYQENNLIYVLGWSKDGKLAFIENRGIDGRGGHDLHFTIQDMVVKNILDNTVCLTWIMKSLQ